MKNLSVAYIRTRGKLVYVWSKEWLFGSSSDTKKQSRFKCQLPPQLSTCYANPVSHWAVHRLAGYLGSIFGIGIPWDEMSSVGLVIFVQ